jgi:hypothetical protein
MKTKKRKKPEQPWFVAFSSQRMKAERAAKMLRLHADFVVRDMPGKRVWISVTIKASI